MSFQWNLSSDEEETHDWQSKLDTAIDNDAKPPARKMATADERNVASLPLNTSASSTGVLEYSEEEDDDIDWEDADSDDGGDKQEPEDAKVAANNLVPVTVDMSHPSQPKTTKKKKKKPSHRHVYRFYSLPADLQSLLLHIQQSHLLALTSRALQLSQCCSDKDLLHITNSLVPLDTFAPETPTEGQLRDFLLWYFDLVNRTTERRRRTHAANVAAGAPRLRREKNRATSPETELGATRPDRLLRASSFLSRTNDEHPQLAENDDIVLSSQDKAQLLVSMVRSMGWRARYVMALDPVRCDLDVDHPLFLSSVGNIFHALSQGKQKQNGKEPKQSNKASTNHDPVNSAIQRELGWVEVLCRLPSKKKHSFRWIHVDPGHELVDQPGKVEMLFEAMSRDGGGSRKRKRAIAYALAVEHVPLFLNSDLPDGEAKEMYHVRLTDVTPRYANSWSDSLKVRSVKRQRSGPARDNSWWTESIKQINSFYHGRAEESMKSAELRKIGSTVTEAIVVGSSSDEDTSAVKGQGALSSHGDDAVDIDEKAELLGSAKNEAIPTSKAAFNNHPIYAIPTVLNANEVLAPDAKSRICGIFKGQPVFRRSDVHTALVAKKWLYQGRKVKDDEMGKPVKRVKARKRAASKGFQALKSYGVGDGNDGSQQAQERDVAMASKPEEEDDGMSDLYAFWQTMPWSPSPVGPNDPIPVNEYNNIELDLLNPGLEHLTEPRISQVAKKLGIPYAPCLLGFEGHGGNRTPTIRGIVVHEHNTDILREAHDEFITEELKKERDKTMKRVHLNWKKLMVGLLTRERLEREYGDDQDDRE